MSKQKEIYLILDNVRSAYNVGAIFRTADAVGVKKIYLCGYTPVPGSSVGEKIAKTALGAEQTVPWERGGQTWRLLKKIKNKPASQSGRNTKIKIAALEQSPKSQNIFAYRPKFPVVLVVGTETKGLSPATLKYVDDIVEIPMFGQKESLNVSVATGIALYQLAVDRTHKNK